MGRDERLENLSPRMAQTLRHLLTGESEKEIASSLRLSPHTVHDYVKALHKRFGVRSRAELLATFVSFEEGHVLAEDVTCVDSAPQYQRQLWAS